MNTTGALLPGTTLQNGKYTIKRVLGQGATGITYLATTEQQLSGNLSGFSEKVQVAIKEFYFKEECQRDAGTQSISIANTNNDAKVEQFKKSFVKEARRIAGLSHPNIVHVLGIFEENNTVYYVMQYIRGGSIKNYIDEHGPVPEKEAVKYALQVSSALQYMHEKKMCHYDLKPGNIMLSEDEDAMLIDFGISKNYDDNGQETSTTPPGLTKGFAPLEQYTSVSEFSPLIDVYSLGATLYAMLTATTPPEPMKWVDGHFTEKPENVSADLWNIVRKAMSLAGRDRPTMAEFHTLLTVYSKSGPARLNGDETIYDGTCPTGGITDAYFEVNNVQCCSAPRCKRDASITPSQKREKTILHIPEKKGLIKRVRSLFGRNGDMVNSAIFAPAMISKGDDMMVQVFIYKDEETDRIVLEAISSDKKATKRKYAPLNFIIKKGDKVSIRLDIKNLSLSDNFKELIWQGKYTSSAFYVSLPENFNRNILFGEITLAVNGLLLGQLQFETGIENNVSEQGSAEIVSKSYKKVFISYSHKDAEIANVIAESYKAMETVDYFYDRHSLSPGEIYERKIFDYIDSCDLFILCWSKNAEKSEWVKKERNRAFYAALDVPPRLRLYPSIHPKQL